ncbi:MAG: hypothetical protein KAH18_05460 [Psychromonas sp.]|nr:hypothetical protein [Psychromonas sp.]
MDLYYHLRCKRRTYTSRSKENQAERGFVDYSFGIEDRASEVDVRSRVGDWEIDLVIGKEHSGSLLMIVKWVTHYTVIKRVLNKQLKQ